jgi:phosphoribosylpyrophosphate synthetase
MLKKKPKSINIAITHWQFNGEAFEKLEKIIKKSEWIIEKVYITNSINKSNLPEYVEVINTDDIIANNIFSIFQWLPIKRDNDKNYSS